MVAMPTLIFEIGFTAGVTTSDYLHLGDSARGILGTNTLAPDNVFVDVTSFLHEVSTQRTSSRLAGPLVRYEAGTLTARLNNTDRRFDPTNLSGPYVSNAATYPLYPTTSRFPSSSLYPTSASSASGSASTQVEPMRIVRFRATWSGTTYEVWRGFADSWLPGYEKGDFYADCSLVATDGFKVLANHDRPAVGAVGAGENAGARTTRILNSVTWPTDDRVIAVGDTELQATTLAGDALTELQLVAETEIGEFYIDEAGRAFFRNRNGIYSDTRSNTSQATFGDSGAELLYFDIQPSYDEDQLVNYARVTRVGGIEQSAQDSTSQAKYLVHTYSPSSDLLMRTNGEALDYARYVVSLAKDAEYRFESLVINPLRDPDILFPQVLGRRIGDRITVRRRPPGGGTIERDVFIVGINHDATPDSWLTTWQLQSASKTAYLVLDHATLGQLDANALAF